MQKSSKPKASLLENGDLQLLLIHLLLDFKSWAKHTRMRRSESKLNSKSVLQFSLLHARRRQKLNGMNRFETRNTSIRIRCLDTCLWDQITPPVGTIQPNK